MKKTTYPLCFLLLTVLFAKAQSSLPTVNTTINISKLIAYEKDDRLFIEWSTDGSNKTNYWEVQGSVDGKNFSTIAIVLGSDPSKPGEQYEYKEKINSKNQVAYFRVVHISSSGAKHQSNIIKPVKMDSSSFINPAIKSKTPVLL